MQNRTMIYKGFERFWHWTQAVLIMFLAATGFEIHSAYEFFGYENAVTFHNAAGIGFIALIIVAIFWHFATGEWRQYLPTTENLISYVRFYLIGIFRDEPHPTKSDHLSKLNPLQKLVYLGLKLLVIPVVAGSGLFYLYYRYPQSGAMKTLNIDSLEIVALLHTAGAFLLVTFLIAHLYLITTGHTLTHNLKTMITGHEDPEDEKQASQEL